MLIKERYLEQLKKWPKEGRHVLAQFNDDEVVVYQAYNPRIGRFAAENQYPGGDFSYSRMSWIKPNFLWMMYRSGWGTKPGQEVTLALHLKRSYFEEILRNAVSSKKDAGFDDAQWELRVKSSSVRLQWDPDHDPYGNKVARRAIQLGLRDDFLAPFKGDGIVEIEDISSFVRQQRRFVVSQNLEELMSPAEAPFPVNDVTKGILGM